MSVKKRLASILISIKFNLIKKSRFRPYSLNDGHKKIQINELKNRTSFLKNETLL